MRADFTIEAAMETIDISIPLSTRGFDVISFLTMADEWRLRKNVGLVGIREIKDQAEFEDSCPQGTA